MKQTSISFYILGFFSLLFLDAFPTPDLVAASLSLNFKQLSLNIQLHFHKSKSFYSPILLIYVFIMTQSLMKINKLSLSMQRIQASELKCMAELKNCGSCRSSQCDMCITQQVLWRGGRTSNKVTDSLNGGNTLTVLLFFLKMSGPVRCVQ